MKKPKQNQDFKFTYKLTIFIFLVINLANALTVINLLPEGTVFTSNTQNTNQTQTDLNSEQTNQNQDLLPVYFQPTLNTLLNQFTPSISTQIENVSSKESNSTIENQSTSSNNFNNSVPSGSSSRSSRGGGSSSSQPTLTNCTDRQVINQTINISCYQGSRTYNTNIVILENTNTDTTCTLDLELDTSSGSAITNSFTAGSADIFFTLSTVPDSDIDLDLLPAPERIGTWTQWENNPLQVELNGPITNTSTSTQTYSVPPNSSRNLGLIIDCGVDTLPSEITTIKLKSTFQD